MSIEIVMGILFSLTAMSSYINYRYLKLPKSIGLTLITLALVLIAEGLGRFGWRIDVFTDHLLDRVKFNNTFLHGMLGFLLFAASLHINRRELAKYKTIVAMLATVSVILSTFIIGFCVYWLTKVLNINIPLEYCLVFGALISPTDPITTLGVLKHLNTPKSLEMKIAGESLFNDGMGIILFVILLGLAKDEGTTWYLQEATWFFLKQGVGGFALGFVMGKVASSILKDVDNDEVAILLTLGLVSGGYCFADMVVGVSGPITMAVAGLMVGGLLQNGRLSKEALRRLEGFWELVDDVLNAILFVLIGLEFLKMHFTTDVIIAAIGTIVITIAARWISVIVPVGSMSLFRKFGPNVVLIMTWGGLRGGISIALALTLPASEIRDFILSITYVVVLFSMIVQGLSVGKLMRLLDARQQKALSKDLDYVPATNG